MPPAAKVGFFYLQGVINFIKGSLLVILLTRCKLVNVSGSADIIIDKDLYIYIHARALHYRKKKKAGKSGQHKKKLKKVIKKA